MLPVAIFVISLLNAVVVVVVVVVLAVKLFNGTVFIAYFIALFAIANPKKSANVSRQNRIGIGV